MPTQGADAPAPADLRLVPPPADCVPVLPARRRLRRRLRVTGIACVEARQAGAGELQDAVVLVFANGLRVTLPVVFWALGTLRSLSGEVELDDVRDAARRRFAGRRALVAALPLDSGEGDRRSGDGPRRGRPRRLTARTASSGRHRRSHPRSERAASLPAGAKAPVGGDRPGARHRRARGGCMDRRADRRPCARLARADRGRRGRGPADSVPLPAP